jgi:iron-sulfur cluster assembly protein
MSETATENRPVVSEEITLTEKAAAQVAKLKTENSIPAEHGLRLGVKGGGCSGLSYVLGFDEKPGEKDRVFTVRGGDDLRRSQEPVLPRGGTVLDFSDGLNGKGFVFNNPQAAKTCGCGSSFGV